jgi:hypothetical protein
MQCSAMHLSQQHSGRTASPSPSTQKSRRVTNPKIWVASLCTMAKGKAKRDGGDGQSAQDQQKVQAILLADSFNTNFRPISYEMPKVSGL